MTKRELEKLNFERVEVTTEESGGEPFYYYVREVFDSLTLISEEVNDPNKVKVFVFDSDKELADTHVIEICKLFDKIKNRL
jgi:hypothetical protein